MVNFGYLFNNNVLEVWPIVCFFACQLFLLTDSTEGLTYGLPTGALCARARSLLAADIAARPVSLDQRNV